MTPAVTLRASVHADLLGATDLPVFVADEVDAIFRAPSDAAAQERFAARFEGLTPRARHSLLSGMVRSLRVAARAGAMEPAR